MQGKYLNFVKKIVKTKDFNDKYLDTHSWRIHTVNMQKSEFFYMLFTRAFKVTALLALLSSSVMGGAHEVHDSWH